MISEENDFFKRCFNIVASLEVQNENQLIAKEVVLDEIKNLQTENQQLKEDYQNELDENCKLSELWCKSQQENHQLKSTLEEIREYIKHEWFKRGQLGIIDKSFQEWELNKLLQIIDKGKCENEVSDTQEKCDKGE